MVINVTHGHSGIQTNDGQESSIVTSDGASRIHGIIIRNDESCNIGFRHNTRHDWPPGHSGRRTISGLSLTAVRSKLLRPTGRLTICSFS